MKTLLTLTLLLFLPLLHADDAVRLSFSCSSTGFVSDTNTPPPVATCDATKDQRTLTSNGYSVIGLSPSTDWTAQKFTAGSSYDACKLRVYLHKAGSPTSDAPGTALGTGGTLTASSVTATDDQPYDIDITATLVSGTTYWIVVSTDSTGVTDNIHWNRGSSVLTNSILQSGDGASWSLVSGTRISRYQIFASE